MLLYCLWFVATRDTPFGKADTPTEDDVFHKLNYGERKVDLYAGLSTEEAAALKKRVDAGVPIFSNQEDVLGTTDVAKTSSQYIGGLDGSIEGQEGRNQCEGGIHHH